MTDTEGNAEGELKVPAQNEETRAKLLAEAPKGATATGQAFAQLNEEYQSPENRGSTNPVAGGDGIVADYNGNAVQKPVGLQAEDAFFAPNGSIDPTLVASPSGLVPVSSVAGSADAASDRLEEHHKAVEASAQRRRGSYDALTQQQIDSMSGAELRAVAQDRGYNLGPQGGTRTTRRKFASEQEIKEKLRSSTENTEKNG